MSGRTLWLEVAQAVLIKGWSASDYEGTQNRVGRAGGCAWSGTDKCHVPAEFTAYGTDGLPWAACAHHVVFSLRRRLRSGERRAS